MTIIFKFLLFLISNIGYFSFVTNKLKIKKEFAPLVTISLQMMVLFFAGLFNVLKVSSILIYLIGIILFVKYVVNTIKSKKSLVDILENNTSIIFLLVVLCVMAILLNNAILYGYDNFSHWGLIVKQMLSTNRLPRFSDTIIQFQQYPLGISSYIYYFSNMVGNKECIWMIAQNYVVLCSLLPLTMYIKKNKIISYITAMLFVDFILCFCIPINSLLVDTALPIFAFGTIMFIKEYCNDKKGLLLCIPLMSSLAIIKNSGIFFVIIDVVFIIYMMIKNKDWKNIYYYITVMSPFAITYLWNRHCLYAFSNAASAKHSMTIENFSNIFKGKTTPDIIAIGRNVLTSSFMGVKLYCIIGFILAVGILIIVANKYNKKENKIVGYWRFIILILIIYVAYMIGTFGMYVFSMPYQEAMGLAGFERYRNTVLILTYCLIFRYVIKLINLEYVKKHIRIGISVLLVSIVIITNYVSFGKYRSIFNIDFKTGYETRNSLQKVIDENKLDMNKKYVVALGSSDDGYMHYLLRYIFSNDNNRAIVVDNDFENKINGFDYLINYANGNEKLDLYLNKYYSSQVNKKVINLSLKENYN